MNVDSRSKRIFIDFLEHIGFTDIKDTDDTESQYYRFDITAKWNGVSVAFELKDRNISSTKYGDVFCCKSKYDYAQQCFKCGKYSKVWVVNFYTDGILAIADINNGVELVRYCPVTTSFGDKGSKYYTMWSMKQESKYDLLTFNKVV